MSKGWFSSAGTISAIDASEAGSAGGAGGGSSAPALPACRRGSGEPSVDRLLVAFGEEVAAARDAVCIFAPPISSRVTFSPITISAIRGEPRYIEALPSRMITTSQKAGM